MVPKAPGFGTAVFANDERLRAGKLMDERQPGLCSEDEGRGGKQAGLEACVGNHRDLPATMRDGTARAGIDDMSVALSASGKTAQVIP